MKPTIKLGALLAAASLARTTRTDDDGALLLADTYEPALPAFAGGRSLLATLADCSSGARTL